MEIECKKTSAPASRGAGGWIATLQSARFPFALLVWLSHLDVPSLPGSFDFGGECAVSFFFVLSGFLLARAYGGRVAEGSFSTRRFLFRHLCKLYPLHLLLFAAVLALDTADGRVWSPAQLAANLLLVQTWLPSGSFTFVVNGVSWYLCDIFFFYLAFACVYRVLSRLRLRSFFALAALYAVAYAALFARLPEEWVNPLLYVNPLLRLPDFAAGIVLCRLWQSPVARRFVSCRALFSTWLLRLAPVLLVVAAYALYTVTPHALSCQLILLPFSVLVILALACADGRGTAEKDLLHTPLALWLGGISFEFFMCHPLVFRLVHLFAAPLGTFASDALYAAVSLSLSVLLAWLLSRFFVSPVRKALLRLSGN